MHQYSIQIHSPYINLIIGLTADANLNPDLNYPPMKTLHKNGIQVPEQAEQTFQYFRWPSQWYKHLTFNFEFFTTLWAFRCNRDRIHHSTKRIWSIGTMYTLNISRMDELSKLSHSTYFIERLCIWKFISNQTVDFHITLKIVAVCTMSVDLYLPVRIIIQWEKHTVHWKHNELENNAAQNAMISCIS